jgi:ACR3 family arsenite efflux pump ArsB
MDKLRGSFDWLAFLVRVVVIAALATWMLGEMVHRHDRSGAILTATVGYVILPVIAYFHTRYYNLKFISGIVEAVRRKTDRKNHA